MVRLKAQCVFALAVTEWIAQVYWPTSQALPTSGDTAHAQRMVVPDCRRQIFSSANAQLGCTTCRTRKVKCDEQRPLCTRCAQMRIKCEWDRPARPRRKPYCPRGQGKSAQAVAVTASAPIEDTPQSPYGLGLSSEDETEIEVVSRVLRSEHELALVGDVDLMQLRPSLSTNHIPLSNSMMFRPKDQEYFQYVPHSFLVLAIGKPWKWSTLSYVHSIIARQEKGVMRAFMALASMELRCREMTPRESGSPASEDLDRARRHRDLATHYYHLALRDLSAVLHRASQPDRTDSDLDALFAMWFLILWFEHYDPELVEASHVHLDGIRSFLASHLRGSWNDGETKLPPASQQLLLFIRFVITLPWARSKLDKFQLPGHRLCSRKHARRPAVCRVSVRPGGLGIFP